MATKHPVLSSLYQNTTDEPFTVFDMFTLSVAMKLIDMGSRGSWDDAVVKVVEEWRKDSECTP